jgi:hypothetical protein
MKIYSSAVFFELTYSIHINENNCSTSNGAGLTNELCNISTFADDKRAISIRELKEAAFQKVRSLTGGRQKPTSRVEIMNRLDNLRIVY